MIWWDWRGCQVHRALVGYGVGRIGRIVGGQQVHTVDGSTVGNCLLSGGGLGGAKNSPVGEQDRKSATPGLG